MQNKENKYQHLMDLRLGLFVHYGIYSALGGFWKGERSRDLGEWIQRHSRIPNAEYEAFAKESFLPCKDFAKEIVRGAKEAGARYIVLTSKHHDGFCLFKTEVDGYNTYDYYGRDLCRELVDECRREGIAVGFYYSHTLDWHEKNAGGNYAVGSGIKIRNDNRNSWDFPDENIDFEQYFRDKCLPQVRELLTNYGPLELIWFDFPHDITPEQTKELREFVKAIQPNCQINSRIAHNMHDYVSLGDNALPAAPHGYNMECLVTLNHTWGYRSDDHDWKSPETMIDILTRALAAGATMLLNVGPMGDGTLTPETHEILRSVGRFTSENAAAIYSGVKPNPFPAIFSFGQVACKENKLFFYLSPQAKSVGVAGLLCEAKRVYRIKDNKEILFRFSDGALTFERDAEDTGIVAYAAEFSESIRVAPLSAECDGALFLHVSHAKKARTDKENIEEPIPYLSFQYNPGSGASLYSTDKVCNWIEPEEYLIFEGEISGGEYEAELVHAWSLRAWDPTIEGNVKLTLSCGDVSRPIGNELRRITVSKTGTDNTHIVREAGSFTLPAGRVRLILKTQGGTSIPVIELHLKKK